MKPNKKCKKHSQHSRGVALITALLLLSLFTVMTLAMVIATTSDTLIDGYYRNYRGSFYASDSGLNAARQYLVNQLQTNAVATTYVPYSGPPVSTAVESTILAGLNSASTGFGNAQSIIGTGTQSSASWPGSFNVSSSSTCDGSTSSTCDTYLLSPLAAPAPPCFASFHQNGTGTDLSTKPTCTSAGSNGYTEDSYTYYYPYQLTVLGQSRGNEQNKVVETGYIILNIALTSNQSTNTSFAAWGMFIDKSPICNGSYLVPGTLTGPVFTNGNWNFNNSGNYVFSDHVGSAGSPADYGYRNSSGGCDQSATVPYSGISTSFNGGQAVGMNPVAPPANSWSQERAVLDGLGTNTAQPTNAELNAKLANISGTAYPTGGASTGVYLPYTASSTGASCPTGPCMTGGGIYVEGNADSVLLSATTSAGGHPQQVFTIKQGSTTTTVTLDLTAKTTTIASGAITPVVINSLPMNNAGSTPTEGCLLYVDGSINGTSGSTITGLSGPSSGPAVQDGSAVTVTAKNDISISGNILYKTEPVTLNTADSLVSGADHGQVLGIFTAGGNVNLAVASTGDNLEIDASVATLQQGSNWAIQNPNKAINTLNIVGGRIQSSIQNINSSNRNVYFDRRFAQGFAPPWFPSTTVTTTGGTTATVNPPKANRIAWVNTTAQ